MELRLQWILTMASTGGILSTAQRGSSSKQPKRWGRFQSLGAGTGWVGDSFCRKTHTHIYIYNIHRYLYIYIHIIYIYIVNLGYSRFTIDYIGLCKLWHDITFQSYRFLGYSLRLGCLQPESNGIGESQLWPTQLFDSVSVLTIVDLDPIGLYYIYRYICIYIYIYATIAD